MKRISKNAWILIAFIIWTVTLWFLGTDLHKKMTPAEAYFGMAGISAVFYGGLKIGEKILAKKTVAK